MATTAQTTIQTNHPDRTYLSMAAAYTLGVFNDNFFKQSALLLALGAGLAHLQGTAVNRRGIMTPL